MEIRGRLRKRLETYQKVWSLRKESKKIMKNPDEVKTRIAVFYEEYNRQMIIVEKKLKLKMKPENLARIKDFKKDFVEAKEKIDFFVFEMNEQPESQMPMGLKKKLMNTRTGRFIILMRDLNRLNHKYKEEDCDIDNFKVD